MAEWLDLRDGGRLLHEPQFHPPAAAHRLFAWLRSAVDWRQEVVSGKPLTRLNAWFADAGLPYRYAGTGRVGAGWPPQLAPLRRAVEAAAGAEFNSLLLNQYRHGQDAIGFHTDALPELGEDPVVAVVSLGSPRDFLLRHVGTGDQFSYRLGHGSLLAMAGTAQHHWLHAVPATEAPVGVRISLTFRLIRRPWESLHKHEIVRREP